MNSTIREYTVLALLIMAFGVIGRAQSSGAPPIYEVKFEKGVFIKKSTVAPTSPCPDSGPTDCGNSNYTNLSLKATKGERIRITLTSDPGGAIFSIATSGRSPLKNGSSVTSWIGTFPSRGDFLITIYTNKVFAHYTLKIIRVN